MAKSILIACPTLGLDKDPTKWLDTLLKIQNQIRQLKLTQAFLAPYRMTWWPANNMIWNTARRYAFDYILRLDDDIWGVPDDAVARLMDADKDVIGAAYPSRHYPYNMCAMINTSYESIIELSKKDNAKLVEVQGEGIQEVDFIGFGMTLIKTGPILDNIGGDVFKGEECCPDDSYFAELCKTKQIQQYVHLDVQLAHAEVDPVNRMYLFNAYSRALLAQGDIEPGTDQHTHLVSLFGEDGQKDPDTLKLLKQKE